MKVKKNIAISENGFIFDASTGESYSVNQIGADILLWLQSTHEEEKVKKKIMDKYEVDEITAEKDLYDFLAILKQFELLETEETGQ